VGHREKREGENCLPDSEQEKSQRRRSGDGVPATLAGLGERGENDTEEKIPSGQGEGLRIRFE